MEGNSNRSTVGKPENFLDWGKRWGTNETEAQLTMQNQWDNLLHHQMGITGITAAMEVWFPLEAPVSASGKHLLTLRRRGSPAADENQDTYRRKAMKGPTRSKNDRRDPLCGEKQNAQFAENL